MSNQMINVHAYAETIMEHIHLLTLADSGQMLHYENGVYKPDGDIRVENMIYDLAARYYQGIDLEERQAILNIIRNKTSTSRDSFDTGNTVNLSNCLYDIAHKESRPHSPMYASRVQLGAMLEPEATAPRFERFLREIIPNSRQRGVFLNLMASAMVGKKLRGGAVMFQGPYTGKNLLLRTISTVFGKNNCIFGFANILQSDFIRSRLDGTIMVVCTVGNKAEIMQIPQIGSMISGGNILAKCDASFIQIQNRARLFFVTEGVDAASYEIPVRVIRFSDAYEDVNHETLKNKLNLESEKNGILNIVLRRAEDIIGCTHD